jgi:hypothetical protein
MKILKSLPSRIAGKLHDFFHRRSLSEGQSDGEAPVLQPGCIARQYAHCKDYAHCRYCGTVEQALRAGSWVKLNWRQMRGRNP